MFSLEHSTFDTQAFGWPTFVLRAGQRNLDEIIDEIPDRLAKGQFLIAKLPADDVAGTRAMLAAGMRKVCVQIELIRDLHAPSTSTPPSAPSDRVAFDQSTIRAHAGNFRFDRLSVDPAITEAQRLAFYQAWVENSTDGRMGVLSEGSAFLSYKSTGSALHIDLLSVLEAGRGTASRLLAKLEKRAEDSGLSLIEVVTETENRRAVAVYMRAGYAIRKFISVFHGVVRNGDDSRSV